MPWWFALTAVLLAGFIGWGMGRSQGEQDRRQLIADLPEMREIFAQLSSDLSACEEGERYLEGELPDSSSWLD